jgi:hypothetical protein
VLVTIVLFLPVLVLVGMEHTLHMLMVVGIVVAFHQGSRGADASRRWWPYLLVFAATLVRFETLFVAAGLGLALLAECLPRLSHGPPSSVRTRLGRAARVGVAAGLPVVLYGLVNLSQGQGLLPSSVLAKSVGGEAFKDAPGVRGVADRLVADPLVATLAVVAVGYLVNAWCGGRGRHVMPATAFIVATGLHVWFARIGWHERYQAYLLALGAYVGLLIAQEVVPADRRALVSALLVAALLFAPVKWQLFQLTPAAADSTHDHHRSAAQFLGRYYDDRSIATGELGYISLFHDGPITDLNGLGDYEVLETRLADDDSERYWTELGRERGLEVVAVYPQTLLGDTPGDWIHVGDWRLQHRRASAPDRTFQFWALTPGGAEELRSNLEAYEADMPSGVVLEIDPLLGFRLEDARKSSGGS